MDPIKTIGQLLTGTEQRDCVHVAIMPVVLDSDYAEAGQPLRLVYGTKNRVRHAHSIDETACIGVADPFMRRPIKNGQSFWVFLKPGSITGLRHDWVCPAIDQQPPPNNEAEKWLRAFASKWNFNFADMIAEAQEAYGVIVAMKIDLHGRDELAPGDETKFWACIQELTGRKFDDEHRDKFVWSCSC